MSCRIMSDFHVGGRLHCTITLSAQRTIYCSVAILTAPAIRNLRRDVASVFAIPKVGTWPAFIHHVQSISTTTALLPNLPPMLFHPLAPGKVHHHAPAKPPPHHHASAFTIIYSCKTSLAGRPGQSDYPAVSIHSCMRQSTRTPVWVRLPR
jgi:hypothetical protein